MTAVGDMTYASHPTDSPRPLGPVLAQPEPGLTAEDFVRRARAMRDHLRSEQEATENRTYYSQETHEAFQQAGFYRMLQPKAFGGYELRMSEYFRVITEVARGCPSTGWCLCLGSAHVLNLASLFDPDVQIEAMGEDGHFIAPFQLMPSVRAIPHEDGWELNGTWGYCSGAPYSTHAEGAVLLPPGEDGAPRLGRALVPRSGYTVLDDWGNTLGLRGSGSHSIRLENTVVPHHYVLQHDPNDVPLDRTVGMAVHGNPMYTGRTRGLFFAEILAIAIGTARAMLDEYQLALLEKKPLWNPRALRAEDAHYQRWYGETNSLLDAADAVLHGLAERYHSLCEHAVRGEGEFSANDDGRLANLSQEGLRYATEAMDLMLRTGGSSALRRGSRTERYWRDFSTLRSHAVPLIRDYGAQLFGAAELEAAQRARNLAGSETTAKNDDTTDDTTNAGAR